MDIQQKRKGGRLRLLIFRPLCGRFRSLPRCLGKTPMNKLEIELVFLLLAYKQTRGWVGFPVADNFLLMSLELYIYRIKLTKHNACRSDNVSFLNTLLLSWTLQNKLKGTSKIKVTLQNAKIGKSETEQRRGFRVVGVSENFSVAFFFCCDPCNKVNIFLTKPK